MADLFLTWEEAQQEQLPHFCVCCAKPATDWVDWELAQTRHRAFSHDSTYVDVVMPVCPEHRQLHWLPVYRVNIREIHDDGLVLSHVSPGFADAVWDYRDDNDDAPAETDAFYEAPPSRSRNRRQSPRPHPGRYYSSSQNAAWPIGKILGITFGVIFLAPCLIGTIFTIVMTILAAVFSFR